MKHFIGKFIYTLSALLIAAGISYPGALMCANAAEENNDVNVSDGVCSQRAYLLAETYSTTSNILYGTDNDVKYLGAALSALNSPYEVNSAIDVSKEEAIEGIKTAFAHADADDISLFYFAGHGVSSTGALVFVSDDGYEYMTIEELCDILSGVEGKVVVMLDSCSSGVATSVFSNAKGSAASKDADADDFNKAVVKQFAKAQSTAEDDNSSKFYVLAGCSEDEDAYSVSVGYDSDNNKLYCGLFTIALEKAIGYDYAYESRTGGLDADADIDNNVSLAECYDYTYNYVAQNLSSEFSQHVSVYSEDGAQVIFSDGDLVFEVADDGDSADTSSDTSADDFTSDSELLSGKLSILTTAKKISASRLSLSKVTFKISAASSTGQKIIFKKYKTSGKYKAITVTKNGKVTLKKGTKAGVYKIIVRAKANSTYAAKEKIFKITVY